MNQKNNTYLLPTNLAGFLFSSLAALLYIISTFDLSFLLGESSYWQTDKEDVTQYIAGFNLYFNAPWQLPLLAFDSVNYPEGSRATFVDIIPLYSLLLKVLLPNNLEAFNPFGIWVALCFFLQAVGAWWITRELKINSWLFLLTITSILLFMPSLMQRMGHISLMSHWLLLFALALYIRSYRLNTRLLLSWSILLVVAFYINIYLFAMVAAIYMASFFTLVKLRFEIQLIKSVLISLVPFIFIFSSLLITIFPLPLSQVQREWGFGYYSMNLVSPFTGGHFLNLPIRSGQYEGFNYLGLGVILAFFSALYLHRKKQLEYFTQHKVLLILMLVFTLYALSNKITFSSFRLVSFSYPSFTEGITSQFRVSGRFFWPVSYTLVIFSLVVLYRSLKARLYLFITLGIMILQLADVQKVHSVLRKTIERPAVQQMDYLAWDKFLSTQVKNIYFYPKFRCSTTPHGESILPMMKYVSLRNLKMNTGYIARHAPPCNEEAEEISATNLTNSAYVFVLAHYKDKEQIRSFLPHSDFSCIAQDYAYICLAKEISDNSPDNN